MTRTLRIVVLSLAALLLPTVCALAQPSITTRYVHALELHAEGESEAALSLLEELASEVPASIPVHRALARVALTLGEEQTKKFKTRFWRRLRRTSRDVGASVGRAIILHAEGSTRQAHNLLLSALTSGARHPLIVPLLVETTSDPEGLATWMENRARVLPRDGAFAALRVEYLLAVGRPRQAGELIDKVMEKYALHPEVLALSARWHRAQGYRREAARLASLAGGALARRDETPETRVPRRLYLARDLIAGGQIDQARAMLGSLGPIIALPDDPPLEGGRLVVEAEMALAFEEPFRSLALLEQAEPIPVQWREPALSVRSRARAALGLAPDVDAVLDNPPPSGFALADRSNALASLVRPRLTGTSAQQATGPVPGSAPAELLEAIAQLGPLLREAGLNRRADLLGVLEAFVSGGSSHPSEEMPGAVTLSREAPASGGAPLLTTAWRLVDAGRALGRSDYQAVLDAAELPIPARTQSPGSLLAALRLLAARAALSMGQTRLAEQTVREGLLDLQEADLSPLATPAELLPVEAAFGDPGAALPGIAFAAALASGEPVSEAGGSLLRNLGRVTRSWSTLGASWPGNLVELKRLLDSDSCLLLVTPEPLAPALAISRDREPVALPADQVFTSEPCLRARVVYWLGPAAPAGGLAVDPASSQVLVRLVAPHQVYEQTVTSPETVEIREIGPGLDRPFRKVVEATLGKVETAPQGVSRAVARLEDAWPVFHGAGISSSRSPLASGWLVPSSMSSRGWLGPEDIPASGPANDTGLVALGLETIPDGNTAEKGSWLLAEAALSSGRPWALLSRHPLADDARLRLIEQLPEWREAPLESALRLIREDPELAEQLTLWTTPGMLAPPRRSPGIYPLGGGVLIAAAMVLAWLYLRRRRLG